MQNTLVLQSHQQPLPANWISRCIDSVEAWAKLNNYEYRFLDDELFAYVADEILEKTKSQQVIATDLARLKVLQAYLKRGYNTVVWCDADFLIFQSAEFHLPDESFAVGREVWIQKDENKDKLVANVKVHNAFMMFRKGNSFLDFYADTAERLLSLNKGSMPLQFIGPKLLTALHNVAQCPVLETAGMLSPLVIKAIANGKGSALQLFQQKSSQSIYAANLCSSLFEKGEVTSVDIEKCIDVLMFVKEL